ncbi:nucleoside deaminase [Pollutibacter soli]|uniref:nucleoside deaminase n=1 Tax=Pollutibacter soli TaxID=3034157 RepID=UPI0030139F46
MNDEYFMRIALKEAMKAMEAGEVPIGAIVVIGEQIIARGSNMVEKLQDTTAHAEMIALTSAFNSLGAKYLPEATVYITVEPCLMCAGAMYWSKISGIVWGADDEKNGFARVTGMNSPFHPKASVRKGVLADECSELMKAFFKARR